MNKRWWVLVKGRGIPGDFGGGNERVPVELKATTYEEAVAEVNKRIEREQVISIYQD